MISVTLDPILRIEYNNSRLSAQSQKVSVKAFSGYMASPIKYLPFQKSIFKDTGKNWKNKDKRGDWSDSQLCTCVVVRLDDAFKVS